MFSPTGKLFVVRVPGANEEVVRARAVTGLGVLSGWVGTGDGQPLLRALAVVPREPRKMMTTESTERR